MRPWVFSAGVAVAAALAACGSAGGSSSAPNSAADWVYAGIAHFRDAASVTVTPDVDGEANCSQTLTSCAPYTLTQTSTLTPSVAECPSIPACASELFSPGARSYALLSNPPPGIVYVVGDPGCTEGAWCSWSMRIDRATQEILSVDIHIGDTDHVGWPTYSFSNYRDSGRVFDTATPSAAPSPTPVMSTTGTLTATFSGDLNFTTGPSAIGCDADGFGLISGAPIGATTPTVRSVEFSPWGQPTADLTVQIFPEPPQTSNGVNVVLSYHGTATVTPLGSASRHVHLTGVLSREGQQGTLAVDATVSCR